MVLCSPFLRWTCSISSYLTVGCWVCDPIRWPVAPEWNGANSPHQFWCADAIAPLLLIHWLVPWRYPHCSTSLTSWLLYCQEAASTAPHLRRHISCAQVGRGAQEMCTAIRPFQWFWWLNRPLLHNRRQQKKPPRALDGLGCGLGAVRRRPDMVSMVERYVKHLCAVLY